MELNKSEYTFDGLDPQAAAMGRNSLGYVIGLVDSPSHKISDITNANRILPWLYGTEEQASSGSALKEREQSFYSRFFEKGYHPQTPCMLVKSWSPIAAMIERSFIPLTLNRDSKRHHAMATGIWMPATLPNAPRLETARTTEELFWAIMAVVSDKANDQKMWISILAQPGWDYAAAIGSLPNWSIDEVSKSGRVLWKRTPEG